MKKLAAMLLAASFSLPALAQEQKFLSKAEVEALATGKKWNHVRLADQNKVRWDLQRGGDFTANNFTSNGSDSGTWLVNDQGQLCVKWRGRSQNRCVAILKDGEKLRMVDSNDLKGAYAELTVE